MKTSAHRVIYLNGNEEIFYTVGFMSAVIHAQYYAVSRGHDSRIKYIVNEEGTQIENITLPSYNISK